MKEMKIRIQFKENGVCVEYNLLKNTVFYGVNGRGKTRVLKSILLLNKLAEAKDYSDASIILNELNISTLKINNVDFSDFFDKKIKLDSLENQKIAIFVKEERGAFHFYFDRIEELKIIVENHISEIESIKLSRYLDILTRLIKNDRQFSIDDINKLISEIGLIMRKVRNQNVHSSDEEGVKTLPNFEKIYRDFDDVQRYIKSKLSELVFSTNKKISALREEAFNEKQGLMILLNEYSVNYVSTDIDSEFNSIVGKMRDSMRSVNRIVIENIWKSKHLLNYSVLDEGVKEIQHRFESLNKTLDKYEKIRVERIDNDGVCFIKNNEIIDFYKLSSGEKRLLIIMMNVFFGQEKILLIDEPEMSLSLNYQNKIIQDIILNSKSKVVMVATHAPFIFEDFISIYDNSGIEV